MILHRAGIAANKLKRSLEAAGLLVGKLPEERGGEGATERQCHVENKAVVDAHGFTYAAGTSGHTLHREGVSLVLGPVLHQQSHHLFGVAGHFTIVRLQDALKLFSGLSLGLWLALSLSLTIELRESDRQTEQWKAFIHVGIVGVK